MNLMLADYKRISHNKIDILGYISVNGEFLINNRSLETENKFLKRLNLNKRSFAILIADFPPILTSYERHKSYNKYEKQYVLLSEKKSIHKISAVIINSITRDLYCTL